ncbi:hypothetical protein F4803DRAFT_552507 [Xylaria telfairii]|nr:hypothetical protein F4803DRAFT_552507 [Xylaria telfairii]
MNEQLRKRGWWIQTKVGSPGTLALMPRLMILLWMQPVNMQYFEEFLASHDAVANWTPSTWGNHASHLWARNVLINHNAIDITDSTITLVEQAVEASLQQHLKLRGRRHNWAKVFETPLWQVYIYNSDNPDVALKSDEW